jgi:hypothetical protein
MLVGWLLAAGLISAPGISHRVARRWRAMADLILLYPNQISSSNHTSLIIVDLRIVGDPNSVNLSELEARYSPVDPVED